MVYIVQCFRIGTQYTLLQMGGVLFEGLHHVLTVVTEEHVVGYHVTAHLQLYQRIRLR